MGETLIPIGHDIPRTRFELLADIAAALSEIETIPIDRYDKKKNKTITKQYPIVAERVKAFRKIWPTGRIITKIISDTGERADIVAEVYDDSGNLLATGHAYEERKTGLINQTSYLENCETSAVGRALAFLGIGIDAGIASADEANNAEAKQDAIKKADLEKQLLNPIEAATFEIELDNNGIDPEKVLRYYKIPNFEQMTIKSWRSILDNMKKAKEVLGKDE